MTKDPKGTWSDGGKVWEGRPGGDYQHGYADGIEWATVHAQAALRGKESALSGALSKGFMTARAYSEYQIIIRFDVLEDMQAAHNALVALSAAPPEQPAAVPDNVKTLLYAIQAKNTRIAELEEALAKAVLAEPELPKARPMGQS